MIVSIYIENDKLDLFNDETIEVNSSVQNVNDITKNTTDYSKNFTVPATEINNRIFKHYYDASIDNGFDARTKVNGRIEIDGEVYKYGKFTLLGAKVKQGNPSSYSLAFFGNLISLVDTFKNDELSVLDLSAYDHIYNSDNVLNGLESGLFDNDIIYTLFVKKQYYYNSDSSDHTDTDTLTNIAYNGGSNGVLWSDLRPSISLLPIIEAIESKYNITFTRDFFGREEFKKLYLWLNKDTSNVVFEKRVDFNSGTNPYLDFDTDEATYAFEDYRRIETLFRIEPKSGFETIEYNIKMYVNGDVYKEKKYIGNSPVFGRDITLYDGTQKVYFTITTSQNFEYDAIYRIKGSSYSMPLFEYVVYGNDNFINSNLNINMNFPKIKIIDFMKGLFNMFKLVVIQENNTDPIYVNTLNAYYADAKLYDVTKYISTSEHDVERGKLLNEILYKFDDPTTILNMKFKTNVGQGYGDEKLQLEDSDGKPLDGDKQDYSVPFEQIVYERLIDTNDGVQTNIQYGAIVDDKVEPTNPKTHIHYVYNNPIGTKTICFIDDVGSENELTGYVNIPSHTLGFDNPQFSTVFGREFNEYTLDTIENTLYTNYHKDYINSIFNFKRRNFKFSSILPLRIVLKLRLNDVLKIKTDFYRINDYTYNLITGKATFNLINSFDNTINGFTASRSVINTDATAKTESIFVTNFTNFSYVINDLGFGTSWITDVYNVGNNIYFDIDSNTTGDVRVTSVTLTNVDTLQEIEIIINQAQ